MAVPIVAATTARRSWRRWSSTPVAAEREGAGCAIPPQFTSAQDRAALPCGRVIALERHVAVVLCSIDRQSESQPLQVQPFPGETKQLCGFVHAIRLLDRRFDHGLFNVLSGS